MKNKLIVGFASMALLMSCGGSQTVQETVQPIVDLGYDVIESVEKTNGEFSIPYTKYQLDNGLTVILHEDHSDPIAHVDVTYHVGSAREEIGKSGFAHFFEHMMFQGSDNVADEEHFKIVSESGGTLNGTTNRDRTNYFETLPSNQLETALWLESDRMGFLLDAVTQKKFEVQRATVKNERGQNYDNRPYGLVREYIAQNLYPYGHPYSWLTIGYIEDLDRVNVDDLKNFFLRWYGPNNAVLTIAGDFDKEEVMSSVVKYFGTIPRGPEVEDANYDMPQLEADRYISYVDNYAQVPRVYMAWPAAPRFHEDEAPLDALAEIIGQGKNSLLYQSLVKSREAMFAGSFNSTAELGGEFTLFSQIFPGKELPEIEEAFRKALSDFEENGVDDEALQRFKASYESNFISGLQSVGSFGGKASRLANYETFANDANYLQKDMARYQNVTKEDVMRVYNKYVKGKPAVILSVLPKEGDLAPVSADNYTIDNSQYEAPDYGYEGLVYNKAVDNFNRSQQPASGPNPAIKVPEYMDYELDNGIKVVQTQYDETPEVVLLLEMDGGHFLSAYEPEKAGVARIFMQMMNEGTENFSAEEFASELEKLGSSISGRAGDESVSIIVQTLEKNLDATMKLLEERIMRPNFSQKDLDRIKQSALQGIENSKKDPAYISGLVFNKVMYGEDDIRAIPNSGTAETVSAITLDDISAFYDKLSINNARMIVVGDVSKQKIESSTAFLNDVNSDPVMLPELTAPQNPDRTVLYLVDIPGSAQSQIRIGYPIDIPYDATGDYYKLGLMNYPLGGAFNSRINLNLREDKGWSYGARSGFSSTKIPGTFSARAGVKKEASDSSIVEFMSELTGFYEDGIQTDELAFMKSSIGQAEARRYETPFQKLFLLSTIVDYDLPRGFKDEQNEIIETITQDEINRLSSKYLDPDKMVIVTIGDKKEIIGGLENLGYPIIELDQEGVAIGSN